MELQLSLRDKNKWNDRTHLKIYDNVATTQSVRLIVNVQIDYILPHFPSHMYIVYIQIE